MRFGPFRLLVALWLFCLVLSGWAMAAGDPVYIGVLAYRPKAETLARWQPTADYLGQRIGRPVLVRSLALPELEEAVRQGRVDFVLTNPGHYILLTKYNNLSSPLATLIELEHGQPLTQFGGVIITRSGNPDVAGLADLVGRRVAVAEVTSFGGYQMQAAELIQAGISPTEDLDLMITGMPQDKVVHAVMEGRAEVGFVRTGLLESLAAAGRLDLNRVAVVNRRTAPGFPFLVSTRLYPEWPLAAMPKTDRKLAQDVAQALLSLREDHPAVRAGGYHGWAIPTDYEPVRAMLQSLRLPPYDRAPEFTWGDVLARHGTSIALAVLVGVVIIALAVLLAIRQRQLRRQEHRVAEERRLLLAALGEGVYGVDRDGNCTFANPAALALLGYRAEELLGHDQHALVHHHRPDGTPYPHADCPIHQTIHDGRLRTREEWFFRKDGTGFPVEMTVAPLAAEDTVGGAVVVFRDIGARHAALARDRLLVSALEAAANAIVITDAEARIEWANPAFEHLTGFSRQEAVGRRPAELVKSGVHDKAFYEAMWQTILAGQVWRGEIVNRKRDGSLYDEELIIAPVPDEAGRITHFVGIKQDISERKRMEAELQALATTDALTGLPNRRHFLAMLDQEMARLQRFAEPPAALLMLDLDHFKDVNDRHGHAAGDAVLVRFADQVRTSLRRTDQAGRLGGEEFAILLFGAAAAQAAEFAERLRDEVDRDGVVHEGERLHVTVSIGLTQLGDEDDSADAALARADAALYQAKANGRNRVETA